MFVLSDVMTIQVLVLYASITLFLSLQEGDALPELRTKAQVLNAMRQVGFELVEVEDYALKSQIPWWSEISSHWSLSNFKSSPAGRWMTHLAFLGMETL